MGSPVESGATTVRVATVGEVVTVMPKIDEAAAAEVNTELAVDSTAVAAAAVDTETEMVMSTCETCRARRRPAEAGTSATVTVTSEAGTPRRVAVVALMAFVLVVAAVP